MWPGRGCGRRRGGARGCAATGSWALASCLGPVGRWSLSGTVFAARQTARSPSRSGEGRACPDGHQGGVDSSAETVSRTWSARVVTRSDRAARYGPQCVLSRRVWGMPGSHGRGPAPALRRPVSSRRQSRTAARSPAVSSSREVAAHWSAVRGSVPVAASRTRWARRAGHAGSSPIPGTTRSAPASSAEVAAGPRWCSAATCRASR